MKSLLVLVLSLAPSAATVADAQQNNAPAPAQQTDRIAEAYAQFLMAHRYEDEEDIDKAIAAYRRAMSLDPSAAEIVSDLANLYLKENRTAEAVTAAEQALKIDAGNREAHRILGSIYAALALAPQRNGNRGAALSREDSLKRGVQHLERAIQDVTRADPNLRAMLAQLHLANKNYDRAIPLLSDLVKQLPDWQEGVGLLMQAYDSAGRAADAVRWLEEAAPDDPQLYAKLGDFYVGEERWTEAATSYAKALPAMARDFSLRLRYARALLNTGVADDVLKARTTLTEALAIRSNDETALFLLSQAERRSGAYQEAERTARRLITVNGRNPRGYVALAELLEDRQRYQEVIDALTPVLPTFRAAQNSAGSLMMLLPHVGFAYERIGQADKAVTAFEEARKLAPSDPGITGYLVQAQISAKKYSEALSLVRSARAQHADDLRLARLEAQALRESGKTDQGIAVLEDFVKQRGDDPRAHVALAQLYSEASRGSQAVRVLQNAQTKFPTEMLLTFELGAVFDKQKRHAEAEAAFRQVIAREPEHAPALNYLGYMLAERGEKLDESVDLVKRALRIDPENGSYLDSLGWAYYKAGRFDLALDNLQRAADQLSRNSVVQDHYGDVLFKLSRWDDAIAAWTRALEGDLEDVNRGDIDRKIRSAKQKLPRR
jgi:tetratricopeptide (TPR) repeat protein